MMVCLSTAHHFFQHGLQKKGWSVQHPNERSTNRPFFSASTVERKDDLFTIREFFLWEADTQDWSLKWDFDSTVSICVYPYVFPPPTLHFILKYPVCSKHILLFVFVWFFDFQRLSTNSSCPLKLMINSFFHFVKHKQTITSIRCHTWHDDSKTRGAFKDCLCSKRRINKGPS